MQRGFSAILLLLFVALGLAGYFVLQGKQSKDLLSSPPEKAACHAKIADSLCKLINSPSPEATAKENDSDLVDGQVRVVLELTDTSYTLPEEYGTEETRTRTGNLLQAKVKIEKLTEVADSPAIRNIRAPLKTVPID